MGDGDLLTGAEGEAEAAGFAAGVVAKRDAADDEAGRNEAGNVAVIRAPLVEAVVGLEFGPEEAAYAAARDAVLDDVVPGDGVAEAFGVGDGQRASGGGLEGESAEALADGEGGGDGGAAASVAVFAGGNGGGEEGGDDGIAALLVAGEDAELGVEADVAEAVGLAVAAGEEGRDVEEELDAAEGDDLEALAVVVDPDGAGGGIVLVDEVGAELLLEARGDEDERGDPVRLLVLRGGDALFVAGPPGFLLRGEQKRKDEHGGGEQSLAGPSQDAEGRCAGHGSDFI
jgi:hypothetical protein